MSGRTGSAVGKHTPIVVLHGTEWNAVSPSQYALVKRAQGCGGIFVKGGEVRTAQALVRRAWGTLTDNGSLGKDGSNADGERWLFNLAAHVKVRP